MKKKKNILKQISFKNNISIFYKKPLKHFFNRFYLKNRFFNNRTYFLKKFCYLNIICKYLKKNHSYINNNFLTNKFNFFNFFNNNLDLKYNNIYPNLLDLNHVKHLKLKNHILLKEDCLDLIKHQKFLNNIDKNCIYNNNNKLCIYDIFKSNLNLITLHTIRFKQINLLTVLINYVFKKLQIKNPVSSF